MIDRRGFMAGLAGVLTALFGLPHVPRAAEEKRLGTFESVAPLMSGPGAVPEWFSSQVVLTEHLDRGERAFGGTVFEGEMRLREALEPSPAGPFTIEDARPHLAHSLWRRHTARSARAVDDRVFELAQQHLRDLHDYASRGDPT